MTVEQRININRGDANISMGGTAFGANMRAPFDPAAQLQIGDKLIFPTSLDGRMGTNTFRGKKYEFMIVEVLKKDGSKTAINWYPSTFLKMAFEAKMGTAGIAENTGEIYQTAGDAVDAFTKERGNAEYDPQTGKCIKTDTQKGVEQLLGKTVVISDKKVYKTVGFDRDGNRDTTKLVDTPIFKYDFAA